MDLDSAATIAMDESKTAIAMDYITKIPIELLGEIFAQCTTHTPDAPLVLSSVCRTFYRAVHITPQAWTSLHISGADAVLAARKAEAWFNNAGTCPLELVVEMDMVEETLESQAQLMTLLSLQRTRIASLALRAHTEGQASSFLSSIYTPPRDMNGPTLRLALHIAEEPHHYAGVMPQLFPDGIPFLTSLRLATPTIPNLTSSAFANMQTLAVTRPIRAHPIPMVTVHDILSASPCLVRFELETRLDLPLDHIPLTTPSPHAHVHVHLQHAPPPPAVALAPPAPSEPTPKPSLVTLPTLTHVSLRTNNNPALLSILVLPSLHTLHLNALDGKRRGRAEETASALQLLLLRMEAHQTYSAPPSPPPSPPPLPFSFSQSQHHPHHHAHHHSEQPRPPSPSTRGIQVLELAGVSIYRAPHGARNELWEWCFRRMRALRYISARNMDTEHLVELLSQGMGRASVPGYAGVGTNNAGSGGVGGVTVDVNAITAPPAEGSNSSQTLPTSLPPPTLTAWDSEWDRCRDNAVCPRLEYLAVPAPDASAAMRGFKLARPFVNVRALGYGPAQARWSSEDALKARRVAVTRGRSPLVGTSMGEEGGDGKGKGKAGLGVKAELMDIDMRSPSPSPGHVGGFGFGSAFSFGRGEIGDEMWGYGSPSSSATPSPMSSRAPTPVSMRSHSHTPMSTRAPTPLGMRESSLVRMRSPTRSPTPLGMWEGTSGMSTTIPSISEDAPTPPTSAPPPSDTTPPSATTSDSTTTTPITSPPSSASVTSQRRVVGGFGFGSQFGRMRGQLGSPPPPLSRGTAEVTGRRLIGRDALF
ncbi:hypothetical protein Hypma_005683 [Hypsizygus marmoreus]|uniref:F-box domain-containing protein n=1 Tax=Hypsizygus marmoreus TaxID=39966 RepID=A0A369JYX1_HYPMA|nr:hypothetical protein Hypma_005683 [Hypsizygus marmoreus]